MDSDETWLPDGTAASLVEGVLPINPFPGHPIGDAPVWSIDPFDSRPWVARLHSLQWTEPLRHAYERTGDELFLDVWHRYVIDWIEDNPLEDPPSWASWHDRTTAVRAQMLACAIERFPDEPRFRESLELHASVLADDDFYLGRGNHALDQNLGLLAAGCMLDEQPWIELATDRIVTLVGESIDVQGGLNEGAIGYARLNLRWYRESIQRLSGCGDGTVPPVLEQRVRALERFIVQGLLPDGSNPIVGDAVPSRIPAGTIPEADFLLTGGASGVSPGSTTTWYQTAGWGFDRSSWTDPDATHLVLRTGRVPIHNHADTGSLVLAGYGRRLLEEGGFYAYGSPYNERYFYRPTAHNMLTVDGVTYLRRNAVPLHTVGPGYAFWRMQLPVWARTRWVRTVLSLEGGRVVVVADHGYSPVPRTWRQLWHLAPRSTPALGPTSASTTFKRGNLSLAWTGTPITLGVTEAQMEPEMQGWVAYGIKRLKPAPTVIASRTGQWFQNVTVLASGTAAPQITIEDATINDEDYALRMTIDGRAYDIAVDGMVITIA